MGLVLTARHSHPGSPGEPPKKKPRVTDDFLEKLGPAVYQQLLHYVDGVVGSEIRSLAAGNFDVLKAYDRLRPEVGAMRVFASPLPATSCTDCLHSPRSSVSSPRLRSLLRYTVMEAPCLLSPRPNWLPKSPGFYEY